MFGTRVAALVAIAVATAACGADRSALPPTAPEPTSPVTRIEAGSAEDRGDPPRSTDGQDTPNTNPRRPERRRPTTTTIPPTTSSPPTSTSTVTTVAPPLDAWVAFDLALSSRLVGSGDYAAAVAVAVDGEVIHTAAYGYRVAPPPPPEPPPTLAPGDTVPVVPTTVAIVPPATTAPVPLDPPDPIEVGDRFRIASISKVITAIVVLQLVEAGQLRLDQPVGALLADELGVAPGDPAVLGITVRQLLSHTAGFPSYQRTFFGGSVDSCPTVARLGLSAPLNNPPGAAYTYSNLNYCLLGLLVEQVAGRPYDAVVQDRLLGPLGITGMRMVDTFDPDPAEVVHPSALGRNYMEVLAAAGSWVATPADIVTILDSLDTTKPGWHPLAAATVDLMRQPAPPPVVYRQPDQWYGLGLIVYPDGAFGHTGTVENTHAMVLRRPDGVTWSVLVSGEHPWESEDLRRIFDDAVATSGVQLR